MGKTADFILKLTDLVSGPARAMTAALDKITAAENSVTGASTRTQDAVGKMASATAASAAKSAASAAAFDRVATSIRGVQAAARAAGKTASLPVAAPAIGSAVDAASKGPVAAATAPFIGPSLGTFHGPVYDRKAREEAMGLAGRQRVLDRMANIRAVGLSAHRAQLMAHPIGPVLDRKAQNLGIGDRLNVATKGLREWNTETAASVDHWKDVAGAFMSTPFGFVLGGLGKVAGFFVDVGMAIAKATVAAVALSAALGAVIAIKFTSAVIQMGALAEKSAMAFRYLTGSKAEGDSWMSSAVIAAKQLGLGINEAFDSFKGLRAQQFDLGQSKALVGMAADLVAVTGHADAAERSIRAITQIKSAGRLQGDELNQLSEAGISRDLVYKQLELSLKTNRAGVMKRQTAGTIDATTAIAAIQAAVSQKLHTKSPGDAARDMLSNTIGGVWTKISNLPEQFMLGVSKAVNFAPLLDSLRLVGASFDSLFDPGKAAGFVQKIVDFLPNIGEAIVGFGVGFRDSFSQVTDALGIALPNVHNMRDLARDAGAWVAEFFGYAIRGGTALRRVVSGLFEGSKQAFSPEGLIVFVGTLATMAQMVASVVLKFASLVEYVAGLVRSGLELVGIVDSIDEKTHARTKPPPLPAMPAGFDVPALPAVRPMVAVAGGGRANAGNTSNTFNVSVNVAGNATREDADEIAQTTAKRFEESFRGFARKATAAI